MAQTFNMGRYVPPDLEGTISHNKASGKGHALGARARKLKTEGVLIVRFECPFPIWCTTCSPEQIIGQGVRFNAEKKEVGKYYSTKIWQFRFKHNVCGGWIEVRTDPKSAEYVVVEGGRRRDYGSNDGDSLLGDRLGLGLGGDGGVTQEEKDALEKDGGFAALEKKVADKKEHDSQQKRIDELTRRSERDWGDPYEMSRRLRKDFRVGRRQRQADEKSGEALQERYGIGIDLLAPVPVDAERAKFVDFGDAKEAVSSDKAMFKMSVQNHASGRGSTTQEPAITGTSKLQTVHVLHKQSLQTALQRRTRSTIDPFLKDEEAWSQRGKRKRTDDSEDTRPQTEESTKLPVTALVSYDSDDSSS